MLADRGHNDTCPLSIRFLHQYPGHNPSLILAIEFIHPEEKAAEEQKKKDEQIAELQAKLLKSDLQKKATASLEKDGYPVGLAELLDYTSEEAMEKSLSKLTDTFKGSLQAAVESRLRGKTPAGLGNAASAENMLRDQIARNIRGL